MVLRYGYFYGPGTTYALGGAFAVDVLRRRAPTVASGAGVCSFIHAVRSREWKGASGARMVADAPNLAERLRG